jgi:hypothetical protein
MRDAGLAVPGVVTPAQLAATVAGVRRTQRPDGAIPWFHGGHLDPWDHVEAAMALDAAGEHAAAAVAYHWLAMTQNPDGSWYAAYADAPIGVSRPTDLLRDANFTAYVAVGAWHHYLATADAVFLTAMWPTVRAALDFVLDLQRPDGTIAWHRDASGRAADGALLSGGSSMYQALRCGLAAAARLDVSVPEWEIAAGCLGHAIAVHPERFLPKHRYSMDWYYPVLGTAVRGAAATDRLAHGWDRFVVPGLGVRCVDDRPWVTGGETCELAMTLAALGDVERAVTLLADMQHLRADDGLYWTGYVYPDEAFWPVERTAWTAGSMLLALALVTGEPATSAVFGPAALPAGLDVSCESELCFAAP